jgi:hypothetical protein
MDRMIMKGVVWMAAAFAAACAPATGESDTSGELFVGEGKGQSADCYDTDGNSYSQGSCLNGYYCKKEIGKSAEWVKDSNQCPAKSTATVSSSTNNMT